MEKFENLPIERLIAPEGFACECGKLHKVDMKYLKIGRGAVSFVPDAVRAVGAARPYVVCDTNTYEAAGRRVCRVLDEAVMEYTLFVIPWHEKIEPDERAIGSIAMTFDRKCDAILAVGSGVVNDLCKVFAFDTDRPQIIVGTAPSMDGYASNSSSNIVNGMKTSLYNRCPQAIVLDTEIMARAPMRMLWAGLGDMVAKYISVCEWRIAHIVTGEYYCEHVAQLMRGALSRIMTASDRLAGRDLDAIQSVAEGLVCAGIAMSFAGVSRPASGLEHYFSHVWEMLALERGLPSDLHGIQVGVGTVLAMRVYEKLKAITPSREKADAAMRAFDEKKWEARVKDVFGKTAPQVIDIERRAGKNRPETQRKHMDAILANWDQILQIANEELPDFDWLYGKMAATGMPMTPEDIGIPQTDVYNAFVCSRDIRDKYLSGSMLWDMGELNDFAEMFR